MDSPTVAIDDIPHIAWTATPEGRMLRFNRQWYDYSGLARRSNATSRWVTP